MINQKFTFGLNEDAKRIRHEVFVEEQGFSPTTDIDEHDEHSWHVVIYIDGYPVSTGRVFPEDPETFHVGRLAVRKNFRHMKIGTYTMKFLMTKAKTLGARKIVLGAQLDKTGFYETLGFRKDPNGEIYFEEGVPHIRMVKKLPIRKQNHAKSHTD